MSTSVSEPTSMDDNPAMEDEKGSMLNGLLSAPPTSVPSSSPLFPTVARPAFSSETVIENKVVSMASNDCSSVLSSPAEASPAKPAVPPTSPFEETFETSPATSHIASASGSLSCTGTSLIDISGTPPWSSALPMTTFGNPDLKSGFPSVLTFKGVSVSLENNSVWKQFYSCGTEMILTKQGRRMFPYCRYRLSGLDPEQKYSLVLSIVPSGQFRYRWSTSAWEVMGPAEHQVQGFIRAFPHHYSPSRGADWMNCLVSFYKLKLTNNFQDQDGHIILHSMHRYIPRLHVIPIPDGDMPGTDQPVVMGPESLTFTFPQTEFMAVTTYQNFRITQLKINHNPFAKGFREDGNNPRLNRINSEARAVVKMDTQPVALKAAEPSEDTKEPVDLSTKDPGEAVSLSEAASVQETRPVLKPIMSNPAGTGEQYVPCMRGKHSLGELVLVQKHQCPEPKEENATCVTPEEQPGSKEWNPPELSSMTRSSSTSTPKSLPRYRKKRKRICRRWGNSQGRLWKVASASSTVVHSPSLTAAMQPELDEIEGLLFVSFASKEALDIHVGEKSAVSSASESPICLLTPAQSEQMMEVSPETVEEKMARLESILVNDLRDLKHRQVIHPVLREVGLKLSSLDSSMTIDLHYLGVRLPPNLPENSDTATLSPADEGIPFISRTGKTSDMTKIKGWKNKFIRSKEVFPNCEGLQKNLSAFCSNMLDEYLESEAQQISDRAATFSMNPEGSVAYQLPARSSSYIKTLDSVLKHRSSASNITAWTNKPCPLSYKPPLYLAMMSSASRQAEAQTGYQSASSHTHPDTASGSTVVSQSLSLCLPGVGQRPDVRSGQGPMISQKPGLTKIQLKLLQMEARALNEGLSRKQLTSERLTMALSALLTKEMLPGQKVAPFPNITAVGSECGNEFCRLGCVCSSLKQENRVLLHCRQPECMFGCACFKRKITKHLKAGETLTSAEQAVQVHPDSLANKLWNRDSCVEDPEPLFVPKCTSTSQSLVSPKYTNQVAFNETPPIREEDKDPMYRYLESTMTCARVRGYNGKPPPKITLDINNPAATSTPDNSSNPQNSAHNNIHHNTTPTAQKAEKKPPQPDTFSESEAKKQIQIQSLCQWKKDSKMILEALCQRMNQNRLLRRFYIGPYCVILVAKIVIQKPSGSNVTYRIQISRPAKVSDVDEEESDDCDKDEHSNETFDESTDEEEEVEDEQTEDPDNFFGVTPFLSGVIPAGRLRARRKLAGCQASGLVQVNGKCYNQARLLLGHMGSLHPANRLAAYVTGRLRTLGDSFNKTSQKPEPTQKISTSASPHVNAAGTAAPAPAVPPERKMTDLKTTTQPPAQLSQPDSSSKGSQQHSQNSSTLNPAKSFVPVQKSSTSSPVSLTVSPSLKSPSFLAQSGTCSFRICPPSNQSALDDKLPGVMLPGGFTLIQLPKPGADGPSWKPQALNTKNTESAGDTSAQKSRATNLSHLASGWLSLNSLNKMKSLLSSTPAAPGPSSRLIGEENKPLEENNSEQLESNMDFTSEDLSSDFSDYGDLEEDDEIVDIETVKEEQEEAIAKMKEAVLKPLRESGCPADGFGSFNELIDEYEVKKEDNNSRKGKRKNHTALERLRRSEQRARFERLHAILNSHPKTPRPHLLSLATKEIEDLIKASIRLEEEKEMLIEKQALYVKNLSRLSGKSEIVIQNKLKEIGERQKQRENATKWRPIFSQLLQSKAALLQATAPQSNLQVPVLLPRPDCKLPSQGNQPSMFQSNLDNMLTLLHPTKNLEKTPVPQSRTQKSLPQAVSFPHQVSSTSTSQMGTQQYEPSASTQVGQTSGDPGLQNVPNSQTRDELQTPSDKTEPRVTAAQSGASLAPNPNSSNVQSLASLPLVRSKTGRIILPSSLKPLGHGFYTLMVMQPKEKTDEDELSSPAKTQPSDQASSKCAEKNVAASDPALDSEPGCTSETATSVDSNKKTSSVVAPLAQLAFLNKSIIVPSLDLKAIKTNQEAVVSVKCVPSSARLCFNPVNLIPSSNESESSPPDPSSHVDHSHMSTPLMKGVPSVSKNPDEVEKSFIHVKMSPLINESQSDENTAEATKMPADNPSGMASEVASNPAPVKRGRGRPPKYKSAPLESPPVKRAIRSPSISEKDSTVTFSVGSLKSLDLKHSPADAAASRPLTRGSLGKDFPSAKKRSWIDVEKELEPDLESE